MSTLQLPPPTPQFMPLSPNFPAASLTNAIPSETLSKWAETAAILFSGPSAAESSAALIALGDCLIANQWTEAAHAW
jgi:COPII coat assembly protein SEC16